MSRAPSPQYPITSVDNALRLLRMFETRSEMRISEAASELGVASSTAHRLMAMLAHHGFVRRDSATKSYRIGPVLYDIGLAAVRTIDVRTIARPVIEALSEEMRETVHVSVLEHDQIRYLDYKEPSTPSLRVAGRTGTRPAHCTSSGKVLLAELPAAEFRSLYPRTRLKGGLTSHSLTSRAELEAELDQVRREGYGYNLGEAEDGVNSVSVPIRDSAGRVVAALNCSAPSGRMSRERMADVAAVLHERAAQISKSLHS